MGSSFLRKITLVKQADYGTSGTDLASAINGYIPTGLKGDWHDLSEWANPGEDEYNGVLVPMNRIIKMSDMAEVPFDGDLTFENADYVFSSGIRKDPTTATVQTTGTQRTYGPPLEGAINTPFFDTVLAGDNSTPGSGKGYAMLDSFIPNFEISAARGDYTKVSGTWSGHTLAALTSPQYANITNVRLGGTSIPAWLWKIYIDDFAGGPTLKTGTLIDWSFKYNSAFHHKKFQDGQISPTSWGQGRPEATLDMTFEQNATALAEYAKFVAGTTRTIQLAATGPTIGAGAAKKTIFLTLSGYYTSFDKPGDSDGNTTIACSFKATEISGSPGSSLTASTITGVTTLYS